MSGSLSMMKSTLAGEDTHAVLLGSTHLADSPRWLRPTSTKRLRKGICVLSILTCALILSLLCIKLQPRLIVTYRPRLVTATNSACGSQDYHCLTQCAEKKLKALRESQSRSPKEAVLAYRRRYQREPPAGFEAWVSFALANNVTLIDEYDQLESDLRPFRHGNLTSSRLRKRIRNALIDTRYRAIRMKDSHFLQPGLLRVRQGIPSVTGTCMRDISNDTLIAMLKPIASKLPDVDILYNWNARPRVMHNSRSNPNLNDRVHFFDASQHSNTETLLASCSSNQSGEPSVALEKPSLDVCTYEQSSLSNLHGFFASPANYFPTTDLVPILSRGKISTMKDILVPNPCYAHDSYRNWQKEDQLAYKEKKDVIYWKGTTTGIFTTADNVLVGQRARFIATMQQYREIAAAQGSNQTQNHHTGVTTVFENRLLPLSSKSREKIGSMPSETFNASFTYFYHTDIDIPFKARFRKLFPITPRVDPMDQFNNKLVADIDGESMSCRFYRQLDSNSVPLKQTIFTEWHEGRILPWLHYIPLSLDMAELPDLLYWLLKTEAGAKQAEYIAAQGKLWAKETLRVVDMTVYFYRVLLELASLL